MIRIAGAVLVAAIGSLGFAIHSSAPSPHPLIVHEWGTVTTALSANGAPAGCLNRVSTVDPLPGFVYRFDPAVVTKRIPIEKTFVPGVPCRPDITMRLETPVMYFHMPAGDSVPPFDVSVDFRGGVLNEFYPNASASANGWNGQQMTGSVVGSLAWHGVTLRSTAHGPATTSHVWLAPRAVSSTPVMVGAEGEQYLFYRGMAHLDAVMRAELTRDEVRIRAPRSSPWLTAPSVALGKVWLVDVRPGGVVAFRESEPLTFSRGDTSILAHLADFKESEYSDGALDRLHSSMQHALVERGLYEDEARAMLETWKRSYFMEPGLRVFYVAPSEWVSYHLPLRISVPHTLTRVIVGRIDLPSANAP